MVINFWLKLRLIARTSAISASKNALTASSSTFIEAYNISLLFRHSSYFTLQLHREGLKETSKKTQCSPLSELSVTFPVSGNGSTCKSTSSIHRQEKICKTFF